MSILFITWDGPQTNYLESLFLPLLSRLDEPVHVLQFTTASHQSTERTGEVAGSLGVGYRSVHLQTGSAIRRAASSVTRGVGEVVREARRVNARVLVPRSTMPSAFALTALPFLRGTRMVFEADGLMADERVDFAGWSRTGARYRAVRLLERKVLRRAELTLTRTERAKTVLLARSGIPAQRIHAIPNGKDPDCFRPRSAERRRVREELGMSDDQLLFIYVGSIGDQYYPRAMMRLLKDSDASARLLVLTRSVDEVKAVAHEFAVESRVFTRTVDASEVPRFIAAADVGLALRKATFSQCAVCPIKVAEYLLCGVPVLATPGVGDLDTQLAGSEAIHFIDQPDSADTADALAWAGAITDATKTAARQLALEWFSLDGVVHKYNSAISTVLGDPS